MWQLFPLLVGAFALVVLLRYRCVGLRLDRVEQAAARLAQRRTLCIFLLVGLSLLYNGVYAAVHHLPVPRVHDEYSYLLQADTFAHGRLSNPTPPLWEHFEAANVMMRPTYMSKYPPAQGVTLAIGEVTTGVPIAGVWLCAAAGAAVMYWMLRGFVSPSWALLGGVVVAIHPQFLHWSQDYWGGSVAVLGGALALGAWARLMMRLSVSMALLYNLGLVILANSRPYEGLLVAIPLTAALLWSVLRKAPLQLWISKLAIPTMLVAAPAATAMGFFDYRVTGHPLRMPYEAYSMQYDVFPRWWPLPLKPQPQYRHLMLEKVHAHFERGDYYEARTPLGLFVLLGSRAFKLLLIHADPYILLLPLGLSFLLWRDPRLRWIWLAVLALYVGLFLETMFLIHYAAPGSAMLILLIILGWQMLDRWRWREHGPAIGRAVSRALVVCVVAAAIGATFRPVQVDPRGPPRETVVAGIPQLQSGRHLVFVQYLPERSLNDEWVYNSADIASQRIVWAHYMNNPGDAALVKRFADRQIWKMVLGRTSVQLEPWHPNDAK